MTYLNNLKTRHLTILSGVLMALANPLWSFGFLTWVSIIPLFIGLHKLNSTKDALKELVILQYIFALSLFFWVPFSVQKLWPQANPWFNVFFFMIYLLIVEFHIIVWGLIRFKIMKLNKPLLLIAISPLLYITLDDYTFKFVKDTLGHNLHDHLSVKQLAHWIGVYGLTGLILLVNELFYVGIINKSKKILLIPIALIVSFYTVGYIEYKKPELGNTIKVSVIQPNFLFKDPLKDKIGSDEYKKHLVNEMIKITEEAIALYPDNKIILWPESIYPMHYHQPDSMAEEEANGRIRDLVRNHNIHLFFGSSKREQSLISNVYIHLYLDENGEVKDNYHTKTKLFPFGEEIPYAKQLPFLTKMFPKPSVSFKGTELKNYQATGLNYGIQICYESVTAEVMSKMIKQELPQVILNPTNEASFISWGEPQLALALSSFRAVESRRPMLRSAATGISAYINTKGEVIGQTEMDVKAIKSYEVIIPD